MKWFKRITLSIILILAVITAIIFLYLKSTAPKYSGKNKIAGLLEKVEVKYDKYGTPHIYAKNEHDAYIALGWVHAQDRLFQMEMIRRVTYGRLSDILGKDLIDVDKSMISLGLGDKAKECESRYFGSKTEEFQNSSLAYLQGINQFIEEGTLPVEFKMLGFKPEKFTPADIFAIIEYMSFGFTSGINQDPFTTEIYQKFGGKYLEDFGIDSLSISKLFKADSISNKYLHEIWMAKNDADDKMPMPQWTGSNSWVLSGNLTKSGKPILANDTHIKYSQPAVWYETYMEFPGHKFYGYYLAGVPYPIEGHNFNYGWGLTIFPFDNMDLYAEKINPENPNQYWNNSKWVNFTEKTYFIKVKGSYDIAYKLKSSKHGTVLNEAYSPIKSRFNDKAISLWWAATKLDNTTLSALYKMNNSKGIDDFAKTMELIDIVGLNVMYADAKGNIAWWATGKLVNRPAHVNPMLIIDGSKEENDIIGFYPFSKNPKSINPKCGYIITANNPPHAVDGITYSGYYAPGLRAKRIEDLLLQQNKWTTESLQKVQLDVHSDRDLRIVKLLLNEVSINEKSNPELKQVMEILKNWNGDYDIKSSGATVFSQFIYFMLSDAMEDEIGEETFDQLSSSYLVRSSIEQLAFNEKSVWWDNVNTKIRETRNDILISAMNKTAVSLKGENGKLKDDLHWGKYHQLTHVHPIGRKKPFDKIFNVGPFEKSGSNEVIDKEGIKYNKDGQYDIINGPALRTLVDFEKPNNALGILPTGQSGNVFSSHYSDQAQMFVDGKYRRQIMEFEKSDKVKTVILEPKSK